MKKNASNIRDVASLAGVSPGSVSKVLNSKPDCRVSGKMRERIFQAAKDLEYTPNINAKRLFSRRTGMIGLIVPPPVPGFSSAFTDRHLSRILGGIEEELFRQGYRLLLFSNRENSGSGHEFLELYNSRQIDGLIVWGAESDESYWQEAVTRRIPLVFISSIPDALEGKSHFILPDFRSAARTVTGKVLEADHRRIVFLDSQSANFVRKEINRGIEDALAGFSLRRENVFRDERKQSEEDFAAPFVRRFLSYRDEVSAIIMLNHSSALAVAEELKKHDILWPRDISIACFDSTLGEHDDDIVRCIVNDWQLGVRSVRTLLAAVKEPELPYVCELIASTVTGGGSIKEVSVNV